MWAVELNCRKEVVWLAINIRKNIDIETYNQTANAFLYMVMGHVRSHTLGCNCWGCVIRHRPTRSNTIHTILSTPAHMVIYIYILYIYRAISNLKNSISNPDPKPHILRLHQKSIGIEFHLASAGDQKAKSDEQQGPGRCLQNIRKI